MIEKVKFPLLPKKTLIRYYKISVVTQAIFNAIVIIFCAVNIAIAFGMCANKVVDWEFTIMTTFLFYIIYQVMKNINERIDRNNATRAVIIREYDVLKKQSEKETLEILKRIKGYKNEHRC